MSRWPHPRVLGHRGGGALAPENTLAGFDAAAASGHRGVEFDVMLSADGTPYLIHDETLERTTDGRGALAETRDSQLDRLDAGSWFDARFAGEALPRLHAAIDRLRALALWANVEIKPAAGFEAATGKAAAAMLARLWPIDAPLPILSSFSTAALAAARDVAPELPRGLLVSTLPADWQEQLAALECAALHFNADKLGVGDIPGLSAAGCWLVAYTVNDPQRAQALLNAGVDAIITDRLDLMPKSWS